MYLAVLYSFDFLPSLLPPMLPFPPSFFPLFFSELGNMSLPVATIPNSQAVAHPFMRVQIRKLSSILEFSREQRL